MRNFFCAFGIGAYQLLAYKTDCACCVGWRLIALLSIFVLLPAAISGIVLALAIVAAFLKGSTNVE